MKTFTLRFRVLLPMTNSRPIENGQLIVEQGCIQKIFSDTSFPVKGELIDLSDCLVCPGFVNAHCHLSLSVLKDRISYRDQFADWVRSVIEENKIVSQANRIFAMHAQAKIMSRSGVTGLVDFISQEELAAEYVKFPFRQTLFLEVLGFLPSLAVPMAETLESFLKKNLSKFRLIKWGLAPHAPYSVSSSLFREVKRLANRYKFPLSCHVAEFYEELQLLKDGGGHMKSLLVELGMYDNKWIPPAKSPVQYLDSIGVLDSLIAVHLNLAGGDLGILKSRKVKAIFCPQSTRWFQREHYMPVRDLLDRKIVVGLGTDSLASNESLNFLDEIRAADQMLGDVSQEEILFMATRGGAEAVGMHCGVIEEGRPADLIGFRVREHCDDWYSVPFEPGRIEADFVMVDGEKVF